MSYESLKAAVSAVITDNANNEITGQVLRELLNNNLIDQLGANLYKGIATPATAPGTPEKEEFYVASESGIYANFNGLIVDNEVVFLIYKGGAWIKEDIGVSYMVKNDRNRETWVTKDAFMLSNWIYVSGGGNSGNKVTINANEVQAKLNISNSLTVGNKYIALINVENLELLHPNAEAIQVLNYSQSLVYRIYPTTETKIFAITFTATTGGNIQVLAAGNVNGGDPVSGTPLVSFNTDFIGCIEWSQEKEDYWSNISDNYEGINFENKSVVSAINAKKADIAIKAVLSEQAGEAFTLKPFFIPTDEKQLIPKDWNMTSGGSTNERGEVVINADEIQPKLQISNTTTIGEKYIAIGYIDKPIALHINATGVKFYNYSTYLFSLSVNKPGLEYVVFDSVVNNVIQLLVDGDVSAIPTGTPLISFISTCMAVVPYSEELENLLIDAKKNYKGGYLYFSQNVYDLQDLKLPENSFTTLSDISSRVKQKNGENIPAWTSLTDATAITDEIIGDIYKIGGTADYSVVPLPRLWWGFDIQPVNYAVEDKTYVIVLEGEVTGTNVDDFKYRQPSGSEIDIAQDLVDGLATPFKVMGSFTYLAGSTANTRYTYTYPTQKNVLIDNVTFLAEFSVFSVFEEIDGFTIDDYIEAAKYGVIIPVYSAPGTATEQYVDNSVNSALNNVSKLDANDLVVKYDIEMMLSGGQSLNVGGGAASGVNDFKNMPSFALGSSLYSRAFTTPAEKDAFYGTQFVLIEDNNANEQYPPVVAASTVMESLISKENKVDVTNYGYKIMPFTWGVSGGSITTMEKGTTAYNDMIECVTKAVEFSKDEGKIFGVSAMNWYQGEADRNQTKAWYYGKLSQLFIDVNTDIKAITGQVDDVQFFTYQTSAWLGIDLGSGAMTNIDIQEAQIQVANDYNNVYLAGAMYQFPYSDYYHPIDRAVVGMQTGVAMKRVLNDGSDWVTFKPISHQVINDGVNYYTHIKFEAPVKPIRFDESGDDWHNPNGKQLNYGFKLLSAGVEKQTAEPFIVKGDTVVITSTENPIGMTLQYAVDGHYGGGNLCDSQNITVRNKNIDYVIDNFAVSFSDYIIS